ncbi:hypothetical protein [Fulvivirga ligni]|uniref:hypothetical protein n=1 Tax=Fulvivirga ligni TaxID=2904246 RepID=UPI001F273054|nr:hypothetical protein [Fulvivirga ligni]UII19161.1 hypothetical protein LVD16_15050 [Fulvivirga ligni]
MCHFITAIISSNSDLTLLNRIGDQFDIAFDYINNDHIKNQIDTNYSYLQKLTACCECGTSLGAQDHIMSAEREQIKDINRLKRKGWSQNKIESWLTNKQRSSVNQQRSFDHQSINYQEDAVKWLGFLSLLMKSSEIGYFGLLFHWYSGSVDSEDFQIIEYERLKEHQLNEDFIFHMKEDIVYEVLF